MPLPVETKAKVIEKFKINSKDTGSPEVQIALLTERINFLSDHFQSHQKDFSSRRGLLIMVSHRSSLLKYLSKHQPKRYQKIIKELNIRK
jgi:small subunit ribosomal protein S15